jgi:spore coat polysaccharide biosynthesis protein SpsF
MTLTLGFLQARMGSTRLPGKALLRIQGKSILERAADRLRAAAALHGVVILTTTRDVDDPLVAEARRFGAEVYRGPDLDVLARFRLAAEIYHPDVIVRATGDNPLIDVGSVDRIVHRLQAGQLDFCMEQDLPYGAATEAVAHEALAAADRLGHLPHHREHVTIYIKEHLEEFRTAFLDPPAALRRPEVRLTVDTPADLAFVQGIIGMIPEDRSPVPLERYLSLIQPGSSNDGS